MFVFVYVCVKPETCYMQLYRIEVASSTFDTPNESNQKLEAHFSSNCFR